MAAPSSASPAVLTTHSSIDEVSEPRRVPHEIFLAILDELIEVSEASMAGALWILTAEFPHFSGWPSGFACQPNFVRQQGHRLACFTRIALISKDAQAYANQNFGRRFQVWAVHQKLRKEMSCHILTLPRIDEFLIHYESFYYIGGRVPWTPDLFCRTSLLPYVETLSIPYISPPDRFARIFSDFSNVRLFLIESQCRDWSKRFNDKHKLCSHGNLLPVDENLLPILQAGSPDRQSIKKALDRGAHVILKCYIDRNDVEVFSTQKGLRVKFSHCEFKCACDATRRDWLEKHRYLSSSERRLTEG
ncbi:hypothetical protein CGCF415_v013756 [Colletotrichum fructicola]|uniref:Uncharacterized protein n=1 Tax=Colletotrichum fructicola (strain Nara gc5) TaxID=1213859 RepID=A0A7J6J3G5_COLFN|nr:uncharacterized protein CGMCC3_g11519 [Colletotrichum fructicola]KAF4484371.1 hypothetical protein CGGC5_v007981 [Colletotrichum fructicola Nara gc5]KAE9572541.1 hypothetical protein CGMCC3_g11519 [Colletotrichum fructicola]KAF4416861.1 hypothetical protein CFRS1_v003544 [Colletotrichum fructicola]KAF4885319.1 hypothetical protein CGCFRS4_v012043 [Colletotrichum fructicola]KAF4890331.1 hypothetical protein CGCF415_v013756 [Colletotrichum fructicola]